MIGLVSTSPSGDEGEARALAARFALEFAPRRDRLVESLFAESGGAPLLLLGRSSAELFTRAPRDPARPDAPRQLRSQRASCGMALLRLARALQGETDALVRAARLREGDRVVDATFGLGADALLAAHATRAPLLAFEKSPLLAAFAQAALRRPSGGPALRQAALEAGARIELRAEDHASALARLPARSAEVVLFDPMFSAPVEAQPIFEVVRAHADRSALLPESLEEARRVATRGVLIKDSPRGAALRALGLAPIHARRFLWGWLDAR